MSKIVLRGLNLATGGHVIMVQARTAKNITECYACDRMIFERRNWRSSAWLAVLVWPVKSLHLTLRLSKKAEAMMSATSFRNSILRSTLKNTFGVGPSDIFGNAQTITSRAQRSLLKKPLMPVPSSLSAASSTGLIAI